MGLIINNFLIKMSGYYYKYDETGGRYVLSKNKNPIRPLIEDASIKKRMNIVGTGANIYKNTYVEYDQEIYDKMVETSDNYPSEIINKALPTSHDVIK
jgi:hypothetical protein